MTDDNYTHLMIIADRSGSMNGIHTDMNGAIRQLMEEQAKEPGTITVDVITFDDHIDVVHENVKPGDVGSDVIQPRGSTALNDAIGFGITRLGRKLSIMAEEKRPSTVIVVVVTDGMENASREYSTEKVKAMVEEQTSQWNWRFMYLAANVDAFATGAGYGFSKGSTIAYAASSVGTQSVVGSASRGIRDARKGEDLTFTPSEREEAMKE